MITVIVPIYNVDRYLRKCIDSILQQSYENLELILVDDGSTDESAQICDQYQERDARVTVIHKQNEGLVRARKAGLQKAAGEYICYVDGDDWIESDMLEQLFSGMQSTGADLVASSLFWEAENFVQIMHSKLDAGIHDVKDIIPIMLYTGEFYEFGVSQFACTKLFRKNLLWDVQMQVDDRINCGEDVAVTYPYILNASKVYISYYIGYHYIQRAGSIVNCCDSNEFDRNKVLIRYLWKIFKQSVYSNSLCMQLNQYVKNLLLTRNIACFDSARGEVILSPYGGIQRNVRIILYGAGRMGQSIYQYLKNQQSVNVVDWLDKNFMMYQKMNMKVHDPGRLNVRHGETYDFILIAVNHQGTVKGIYQYLKDMGISKEKIKWLSEDFIKEDFSVLEEFVK